MEFRKVTPEHPLYEEVLSLWHKKYHNKSLKNLLLTDITDADISDFIKKNFKEVLFLTSVDKRIFYSPCRIEDKIEIEGVYVKKIYSKKGETYLIVTPSFKIFHAYFISMNEVYRTLVFAGASQEDFSWEKPMIR